MNPVVSRFSMCGEKNTMVAFLHTRGYTARSDIVVCQHSEPTTNPAVLAKFEVEVRTIQDPDQMHRKCIHFTALLNFHVLFDGLLICKHHTGLNNFTTTILSSIRCAPNSLKTFYLLRDIEYF
jgi:hypothetical protein